MKRREVQRTGGEGRLNFLVVEDNVPARNRICQTLDSLGQNVVYASTQDAVNIAVLGMKTANEYNVFIFDMDWLKKQVGATTVALALLREQNPKTRIFALTLDPRVDSGALPANLQHEGRPLVHGVLVYPTDTSPSKFKKFIETMNGMLKYVIVEDNPQLKDRLFDEIASSGQDLIFLDPSRHNMRQTVDFAKAAEADIVIVGLDWLKGRRNTAGGLRRLRKARPHLHVYAVTDQPGRSMEELPTALITGSGGIRPLVNGIITPDKINATEFEQLRRGITKIKKKTLTQ